jgi:ABC-type glycerol-3-phosphate transport system permease component
VGRWSRRTAAVVCVIGAGLVLLPFFWMVSTSLKTPGDVFLTPVQWLPTSPQWDNYQQATTLIPFWRYFANSLLVAVPVVIGNVVSCAAVAYGFARLRAPGLRWLFLAVLAMIMLPGEITLLPSFVLYNQIGWVGTYLPLVVPAWLAVSAFNIFLLRQYFLTIPIEHDEAARVDGHSFASILLRVIIPQAWPAIGVVAAFQFVGVWNDFLGPLIYITNQDDYTLPLGLAFFRDLYNTQWTLLMAASVLSLLPCVVIFFLAQRAFTEGVVVSGRKG